MMICECLWWKYSVRDDIQFPLSYLPDFTEHKTLLTQQIYLRQWWNIKKNLFLLKIFYILFRFFTSKFSSHFSFFIHFFSTHLSHSLFVGIYISDKFSSVARAIFHTISLFSLRCNANYLNWIKYPRSEGRLMMVVDVNKVKYSFYCRMWNDERARARAPFALRC